MGRRVTLVVHERRDLWVRQLRPRVVGLPVTVRESRSAADLGRALSADPAAVVVADLGAEPFDRLSELEHCRRSLADALVLVLDPESIPGVALIAREVGATLVRSGFVSPPDVARILTRWITLASRRSEAAGWAGPQPAIPPGSPF